MRALPILKDPFVLLAVVALWLTLVKPAWLATGVPGAVFGVVATLAVTLAVLGLLIVVGRRAVSYATPTTAGAIGMLVKAVVLAGCVLYADPSRTNWTLFGIVGPGLALLMFGLGAWYRRGSSSRPA